ncbi:MAG: T9SS type A sorting domain-containing protein [Bacteroidota bacterium]
MKKILVATFLSLFLCTPLVHAQHSVARDWNEELLNAIRGDFARPTVHARNLFHSAVAMYDAWAVFDSNVETVFLGKTYGNYASTFNGIATPTNLETARHEVISYAMFRLLTHRFANSPGATTSLPNFQTLFESYGYDVNFTSTDYSTGSYAALGNHIANEIIAFGMQDGANEQNDYANEHYQPVNSPIILDLYQDNGSINPDRWQPLAFDVYIDQSGNTFPINTPPFLSPEWGEVTPFALKAENLQIINENFDCYVYSDPGPPVYIQNSNEDGIDDPYKWHFALVSLWSSHLDPADNTMIDISPGAIGNLPTSAFPDTFQEYQAFYDIINGGDPSTGHAVNPATGLPYASQMVKRADYARVLAEFWADGPDSETPPGHWFTIMNYVSDHPMIEKRLNGSGPILGDLEWDVKCYLALGGAMHDAAINTWGIKGYYDYVRPISAIRYMAAKGQSSDASLPSYDPHGLPLIPNYIELIETGDPLAGTNDENVGKVKVYAWKGPDYISDPTQDIAGVDWILASQWWPYQRGTFVTPPFAGYLSGHSTFSRAAAEVLTLLTGDEFFPGGMGTFDIPQDNFLVFEKGPSAPFTLQWATYRDASDQTSLSRIWGGIHPPIDDIRGRIIGAQIGVEAFNKANDYFSGVLSTNEAQVTATKIYPIPFTDQLTIQAKNETVSTVDLYSIEGRLVFTETINATQKTLDIPNLQSGLYFVKAYDTTGKVIMQEKVIKK